MIATFADWFDSVEYNNYSLEPAATTVTWSTRIKSVYSEEYKYVSYRGECACGFSMNVPRARVRLEKILESHWFDHYQYHKLHDY